MTRQWGPEGEGVLVGIVNGVCDPKHRVPGPHNIDVQHVLAGDGFAEMRLRVCLRACVRACVRTRGVGQVWG